MLKINLKNAIKLIFILLLLYIHCIFCISQNTSSSSSQNNNFGFKCEDSICAYNQSKCDRNQTKAECVCLEGYKTIPLNNTVKCNYPLKKQLTAFLLESVFTYGIGHYYTENYAMAVPKMFFWFISYCLFIFLRNILRTNENQEKGAFLVTFLAAIFLLLMFSWQITDMVLYALNYYPDGNGIPLLPWNVNNNPINNSTDF